MNNEFSWIKQRPNNGEIIEAFSVPLKKWFIGTYYEDGVDGIIEWQHDNSICEIEEYGEDVITKWRYINK